MSIADCPCCNFSFSLTRTATPELFVGSTQSGSPATYDIDFLAIESLDSISISGTDTVDSLTRIATDDKYVYAFDNPSSGRVRALSKNADAVWEYLPGEECNGGCAFGGGHIIAGVTGEVRRIDESGNHIWTYSHPVLPSAQFQFIDVASDGRVAAMILSNSRTASIIALFMLDEDGNLLWSKTLGDLSSPLSSGFNTSSQTHIAFDSGGYLYVGGRQDTNGGGIAHKFDEDGNTVWTITRTSPRRLAECMTVDRNGDLYFQTTGELVEKWEASTPSMVWQIDPGISALQAMHSDPLGNLYVGGRGTLKKYDTDGVLLDSRSIGASTNNLTPGICTILGKVGAFYDMWSEIP